VSASPAPTIPSLFTGVLGKWDYIDQYDVFIGVNNAHTGDIWVYKPEGWNPSGYPPLQNNGVTAGLENDAPVAISANDAPLPADDTLTIEDVFSQPGGSNHINTLAGDVDTDDGANSLLTFATLSATLLANPDESAAPVTV
jgi:hypothetical protein